MRMLPKIAAEQRAQVADRRREQRSVACPKCGAPAGARCTGAFARPMQAVHTQRTTRWKAAQR